MAQHVTNAPHTVDAAGSLHEGQRLEQGLQSGQVPHHAALVEEPGSGAMIGTAVHRPQGGAVYEEAGPAMGVVDGQRHGETMGLSLEERERQMAAEETRLRARDQKLAKQADVYVEKQQRDAHAHVQHEIAKADKQAEKAISKAAHKEATVHKKVEHKLAEAAQERKNAEIEAEHKAAEKKAAAQHEAEEMIAAAKEKAEAIKRGDEVIEKPSTFKKMFGMA